jgi:hypothetical protein
MLSSNTFSTPLFYRSNAYPDHNFFSDIPRYIEPEATLPFKLSKHISLRALLCLKQVRARLALRQNPLGYRFVEEWNIPPSLRAKGSMSAFRGSVNRYILMRQEMASGILYLCNVILLLITLIVDSVGIATPRLKITCLRQSY